MPSVNKFAHGSFCFKLLSPRYLTAAKISSLSSFFFFWFKMYNNVSCSQSLFLTLSSGIISRAHMWCWKQNGQLHARQGPHMLYYLSGPLFTFSFSRFYSASLLFYLNTLVSEQSKYSLFPIMTIIFLLCFSGDECKLWLDSRELVFLLISAFLSPLTSLVSALPWTQTNIRQ